MDGCLSDNSPVLDENAIVVSPFGGESDICPKNDLGFGICLNFDYHGTSIYFTFENVYRTCKALIFPPTPDELKQMFYRGCRDGFNFIKSRSKFKTFYFP